MHIMNEIIILLLSSAIIAIPFILLSRLINGFLLKYGYIRPRKENVLNWITTWLLIFGKQLLYPGLPWGITAIILILGLIFSDNRYELSQTTKKGRWWWRKPISIE